MMIRARGRVLVVVLAVGLLGTGAVAVPAEAGPPPPGGNLFFINSVPFLGNGNLYSLDPETADATLIGSSGVRGSTVGAAESPLSEVIFGTQPNGILTIDTDEPDAGYVPGFLMQGLAWDPVDGILYGSFGSAFFTVDPRTARATPLTPPPTNFITGLAWREGLVYALDVNGVLFSFDPNGQTWNDIGATTLENPTDNGLAWNPSLDVFYAIDADGGLYTINPADAATIHVGSTGVDAGGGLAFVPTTSEHQPDGRIRNASGGGDVGDHLYNIVGDQTVTKTTPRSVVTEHLVKVQNDGPHHSAFRLSGTHGTSDWKVRYRVRGVDVTPAVVDGSYVTRVLAPGELFRMRVQVKPRAGAPLGGDGFGVDVSASNGDQLPLTDTVRAVTIANG